MLKIRVVRERSESAGINCMNDVDKLIELQKRESQKTLISMSKGRKAIGYLIVVVCLLISANAIIGLYGLSKSLLLKIISILILAAITLVIISLLLKRLHVSNTVRNYTLAIAGSIMVPMLVYLVR